MKIAEMQTQAESIHRFEITVHFKRLTKPSQIIHLIELLMSDIVWECNGDKSRSLGIIACHTNVGGGEINAKALKLDGRVEISGGFEHPTNKISMDIDLSIPGFPESLYMELVSHTFEHFIPQIGFFEIEREEEKMITEWNNNHFSHPQLIDNGRVKRWDEQVSCHNSFREES
jgi:hypothetical protein